MICSVLYGHYSAAALSWWDLPAQLDFLLLFFNFILKAGKKTPSHTAQECPPSFPSDRAASRVLLTYFFCSNFAEKKSLFVLNVEHHSSSRQRSYISGVWFALCDWQLCGEGETLSSGRPWELSRRGGDVCKRHHTIRITHFQVDCGHRRTVHHVVRVLCWASKLLVLANPLSGINQSINQSADSHWWRGEMG